MFFRDLSIKVGLASLNHLRLRRRNNSTLARRLRTDRIERRPLELFSRDSASPTFILVLIFCYFYIKIKVSVETDIARFLNNWKQELPNSIPQQSYGTRLSILKMTPIIF